MLMNTVPNAPVDTPLALTKNHAIATAPDNNVMVNVHLVSIITAWFCKIIVASTKFKTVLNIKMNTVMNVIAATV